MATLIFKDPIVFQQGTGLSIIPGNTELFAKQPRTVTFSIGQAVANTSDVKFNKLTPNSIFIDNGTLQFSGNTISGSLTQAGNLVVTTNFNNHGPITVVGNITFEKLTTQLTQATTLFNSGSTLFGDTTDDTHQYTGSLLTTGSFSLDNYNVNEISNDTSLTDSSTTSLVTGNAAESYASLHTKLINTYNNKSFAHTGSFVNVSTSSFAAVTASAPSTYTATSVNDFMFFLNGGIMENDSLNIQQSGSLFLLKVDNGSIGYNLSSLDEIVAFGKFNS